MLKPLGYILYSENLTPEQVGNIKRANEKISDPSYKPSPRVQEAIRTLREGRRLSWEELNRAATI